MLSKTLVRLCANLFVIFAVTMLVGTAWGQTAVGFTTPPPLGTVTIEGCRNDGTIKLPTTNNAYAQNLVVCPDAAYTTGNLGKGWNELDLVPFRVTTTTNAKDGPTTYNLIIAGEYCDGGTGTCTNPDPTAGTGVKGWDVIGSDEDVLQNGHTTAGLTSFVTGPTGGIGGTTPIKNPNSDSSCSAQWNGYFTSGPGLSGSNLSIYRTLQISQNAGTTCVFDYYMRLALGSHDYPGSSLHGFIAQTADFTGGQKDVPLPVNQIAPQSLSKTMTATQGTSNVWQVGKTVPSGLDFANVCPNPTQPQTKNVTIDIAWTKTATLGGITVTATITATNPSARTILVSVTDKVYTGSLTPGSGTQIHTGTVTAFPVPANTSTTVLTDSFTDSTTSDSLFNDVATATYTDQITGIPVPGNTTATSFTTVVTSGGTAASAQIAPDQEDLAAPFSFSLNSVTTSPNIGSGSACAEANYVTGPPPSCTGYTIGGGVFVNGLNWLSPVFSTNGSATVIKSIQYAGSGPATGSLTDKATLVSTDGSFTTDSGTQTIAVSAEAQVNLTINKSINPSGATVTFTFHVFGSNNLEIAYPGGGGPPQIAFPGTGTVTLTGLQPDTYTVTEDAVAGWTETDCSSQATCTAAHTVNLSGTSTATCSGGVTFANSQPDAYITVTPQTATNEVGHQHTFHFVLTQVPNGATPATSGTITPNITPSGFTTVTNTCGTVSFNGGLTASCDVTINSTVVATYTANATGTVTIGGVTLTRQTGDGLSSDSGPATKNYVDASIAITPSTSTNEVGNAHTFTVTVTAMPGLATPVVFNSITVSVTPTPDITNTNTCASPTVNGNVATCTVTINNSTAGTFTINASATVTMGGTAVTRSTSGNSGPGGSGSATKNFVDANITISPLSANNNVGQPHTFTITVTQFPASATPATSVNVTYVLTGTPSSLNGTCGTTGSVTLSFGGGNVASCTLIINSTTPQTFTLNATATLTIGGVTLTRSTGDAKSGDSGGAVKNYLAGQIQVIKNTLPPSIDGTFGYTDNFSIPAVSTTGGTGSQLSGFLAPGNGYSISEVTPNNGQVGWAMVGAVCDNGSTLANVVVTNGNVTHCTFTNATAFVKVIKTFQGGPIPAGSCGNGTNNINPCAFTFQLRIGASTTTAGTILDTLIANNGNGGVLNFTDMLIPGVKYAMCEVMSPGWSTNFGSYSVYNPSGDNSTWCADFTPTAGTNSLTTFNIDNTPPPGGMALTIGFWKNWSSCSGGKQKHTLDLTLFTAQTALIPWTGQTGPGINVGNLALYTSATADPDSFCTQATDVLKKSSNGGKGFSSNPAYNMAAQLLGAELNIIAGAGYNACTISLVTQANNLLTPVTDAAGHKGIDFSANFYANTAPKLTTLQTNAANYLQTQLNNYNNNLAYTCNSVF